MKQSSMKTREQWLNRGVEILNAEVFAPHGKTANNVRVSVGWPSGRSGKNSAIGQCWPASLSEDQATEIFIAPSQDDPVRVLDILAHEMVHAIVGCKHGHKAPFKKLAVAIGLTGKMTATVAGEELAAHLKKIADKIGKYPHAKLNTNAKTKQTTRLLKIECPDCDNVARQSRTAYENYGLDCPVCRCPMIFKG